MFFDGFKEVLYFAKPIWKLVNKLNWRTSFCWSSEVSAKAATV
jgi:hypothetical protein